MLSVEGLRSSHGRVEALHGVSIDVAAGELVTLVGGNGAGKTTLLRAISGVQPVSHGAVCFEGTDITAMPAHRRVGIGIAQVPEGRQVFGPLTVEDNLRLGAWPRRTVDMAGGLSAIYRTFPMLAEKRLNQAGSLSGGQQQMLAIGRALMSKPKLLLLDEPSMGLAPVMVDQIFEAILALRAQGMTLLLVEQNASLALSIADRGYVIETGRITHSGTGAALLSDPRLQAAYLGV